MEIKFLQLKNYGVEERVMSEIKDFNKYKKKRQKALDDVGKEKIKRYGMVPDMDKSAVEKLSGAFREGNMKAIVHYCQKYGAEFHIIVGDATFTADYGFALDLYPNNLDAVQPIFYTTNDDIFSGLAQLGEGLEVYADILFED
jgi:hypothetical protein